MAENEKKTGEKTGAPSIQARVFLLAMLLLIAGTIALLVFAYFNHGGSLS